MTAALAIADQGFEVHLVEKEARLGGLLRNGHSTLEGADVQAYLRQLVAKVESSPEDHGASERHAWLRSRGTSATSRPCLNVGGQRRNPSATAW